MKGKKKQSRWNLFVKKIFHEGQKLHHNYSFKQALADASSRKKELNTIFSSLSTKSHTKQNSKKKRSGTRKRRR